MSKSSQLALEKDEAMADKLNKVANKINEGDKTTSTTGTNIVKATTTKKEKDAEVAKIVFKSIKPKEATEFDNFKAYVNAAKLAIKRSDGSVYLKAEAWLYLAHLKEVYPSVEIVPVYSNETGKIIRCTAICKLYNKDGDEISQAAMTASKEETFLANIDDYAVIGMAQTRAITRCLRNVYGYVARGAGFESTPAVEMGLERDFTE